jgi:hypothetical protein
MKTERHPQRAVCLRLCRGKRTPFSGKFLQNQIPQQAWILPAKRGKLNAFKRWVKSSLQLLDPKY